jgi:hypothetical protein
MRAVPAITVAFTACLLASTPARAEDPVAVSRHVIEQQIDAFLKDDAETAYSFAAPGIKARYPDKDAFFAMVKRSYQPVYHPGNYAFGRNKSIADGAMILHEVTITGQDGKNWKAIYKMARQPDGSYKIEGVLIVPDTVSKAI